MRARRTRVVEDGDLDRGCGSGAQDPERADGEVEHVAAAGVDRDALGQHPAQRHVRRPDAVGAQHHLVEGVAGADPNRDAGERPRHRVEVDAGAAERPARGRGHGEEPRRRDAFVGAEFAAVQARLGDRALAQQRPLGEREGPQGRRRRRARPVDAFPLLPDLQGGDRGVEGPADRVTDAAAVDLEGVVGDERGGRDRRPLRSEPDDVLARVHDPHRPSELVGERPRRGRCQRVALSAEGSAVGERRRRRLPGLAPRGVGFEVGGLDPAGGQAHAPVGARRTGQGRVVAAAGPSALHLPGPGPGVDEGFGDHPSSPDGVEGGGVGAGRQRDGDEGRVGGGVVGEAPGAERHLRSDLLRDAPFEGGAARRGVEATGRIGAPIGGGDGVDHGPPAGASTQMRGEGSIDPRGGRAIPVEQRRGAHEDARGAEAALRRAGRQERIGEPGTLMLVQSFDGGDVTSADPRRGGDARDPRRAVDEDGAAPALTLGRAPVLR